MAGSSRLARRPRALLRALGLSVGALLGGCVGRPQLASEVPLFGAPGGVAVIALHGSGQTGAGFLETLHLEQLADELGLLVSAPDARTNASFLGTGWLESDESRLIELVDRMGGEARLIGYSSGGFQACFLALKYPERFPRVCVIAGGILERHASLLPEAGRRPAFWFVAGEDDTVVPLDEGRTPVGRSLELERFLGPRAAARLVSGMDEPEAILEVDLVRDPAGWKPFGERYRGAETRECRYGDVRLSVVSARGHLDDLGPDACAALLHWLVE